MFILPSDLKLRSNMGWNGAPEPGITDEAFPKSVKSIYFTCSLGKKKQPTDIFGKGMTFQKGLGKCPDNPSFYHAHSRPVRFYAAC